MDIIPYYGMSPGDNITSCPGFVGCLWSQEGGPLNTVGLPFGAATILEREERAREGER